MAPADLETVEVEKSWPLASIPRAIATQLAILGSAARCQTLFLTQGYLVRPIRVPVLYPCCSTASFRSSEGFTGFGGGCGIKFDTGRGSVLGGIFHGGRGGRGIFHGGSGGHNFGRLVPPFISMSKNSLIGISTAAGGCGSCTGFGRGCSSGFEGGVIKFDRGRGFRFGGGGIRVDKGRGSGFSGSRRFGLPFIGMSKYLSILAATGGCGSGFGGGCSWFGKGRGSRFGEGCIRFGGGRGSDFVGGRSFGSSFLPVISMSKNSSIGISATAGGCSSGFGGGCTSKTGPELCCGVE